MINAVHALVFAEDAEAARGFFRDVLDFPYVDDGGGWLIFSAPPTELAVHPGPGWERGEGQHMLFLMCDDIERTVDDLREKGVEFAGSIKDEEFGRMIRMKVSGAGEIGLYQPTHASPLDL